MKKILITICLLMLASAASATYTAGVHLTTDITADSVWGIPIGDGARLADSFHTVPGAGNWKSGNRVYDTALSLMDYYTDLQCLWKVYYPGNETTFVMDNITTNILADTLNNPQIDTLLLAADSNIFATSALGTWLVNNIGGAGGIDSSKVADIVKYYHLMNMDSTGIDTSRIGAWLIANIGGGGLTKAQIIDSFQTMLANDTGSGSWMGYLVMSMQRNLDSIKAVLDSVRALATITEILDSTTLRKPTVTADGMDSILGFAADANTKVKVPIAQMRDTISLYDTRWDSLLAAATNASAVKIWNIAFSTGFTAGSMGDSLNMFHY